MTEDDAIERFWADAKVRANLNRLRAYTGPNASESLRPPAWAFGDSPELADELVGLVLDGRKTATAGARSEEHTSELQSLMRISYAVFCLKKKKKKKTQL